MKKFKNEIKIKYKKNSTTFFLTLILFYTQSTLETTASQHPNITRLIPTIL